MKQLKLGSKLEKVVDVIGEILAFLTVALIVFMYINRIVAHKSADGTGFLSLDVTRVLESIREIAILLVVGLAGLEFALKRGFVVFLIYAVLVTAAIIFIFFPGVLPVSVSALTI